ncbi:hypothetical protein HPP92_007402 [Vanilla planifolia]|uniref:Uncharacterized protein n=1 Tax=Vanilla planifolia TaxID=51239 RepID=A0A835V7P3_VANPL|nr:hypothetical protein HPP92_007402 [Vanilla planifolia]
MIQTHDGEECIEDLVDYLCPTVSHRPLRDGFIEKPGHKQEEYNKAAGNKKEPDKKSHVHWMLDPVLAVFNKESPVDLSDKWNSETSTPMCGDAWGITWCRIVTAWALAFNLSARREGRDSAYKTKFKEPVLRWVCFQEIKKPFLTVFLTKEAHFNCGNVDGN